MLILLSSLIASIGLKCRESVIKVKANLSFQFLCNSCSTCTHKADRVFANLKEKKKVAILTSINPLNYLPKSRSWEHELTQTNHGLSKAIFFLLALENRFHSGALKTQSGNYNHRKKAMSKDDSIVQLLIWVPNGTLITLCSQYWIENWYKYNNICDSTFNHDDSLIKSCDIDTHPDGENEMFVLKITQKRLFQWCVFVDDLSLLTNLKMFAKKK